jgi:hypothetical protein
VLGREDKADCTGGREVIITVGFTLLQATKALRESRDIALLCF